jgi:DNA-binding transcriptional MerR regulator
VSHLHLETAQWLTDQACAEKFPGVRPGTIREWARRGLVARRRDSGRVLYAVLAVESQARLRGLLAKKAEGLVP